MPIYEYKCPQCGVFERQYPMSQTPKTVPCASCNMNAHKILSAVGLSRLNSAHAQIIDSTQASAHQPQVVSGRLGATPSAQNITRNPLHAKLPHP